MIDVKSGVDVVIKFDHHEVHHGHSFKLDDVQEVDTTTKKWMVTTPNTKKYAHMIFDVLVTGEVLVVVTEGADRTGTTLLTPINRNRVGTPNVATVAVHRDVSGGSTDGATTIRNVRFGKTDKFSGQISEQRGQNEYVLKPNTKYVIAVTTYADDVFVSLNIDWYEHEDKRMQDHFNVE